MMLCLSVFSMRTVLTLVCVDDAVSQCVQHADSLHVGVCRCRCVSVCSACGQSSLRSGLTEYNFIANC